MGMGLRMEMGATGSGKLRAFPELIYVEFRGSASACGLWKRRELLHLGLFMECIFAVQPELIGKALVGIRIMGYSIRRGIIFCDRTSFLQGGNTNEMIK